MRSSTPLSTGVFVLLASVLVGCSAGTAERSTGDLDDSPITTSEPTASTDTRPAFPLDEFLGALNGTDLSAEEQEAQFAAERRQEQDLVSQCMAEQGFEYIPTFSEGPGETAPGEYEPDDRDWVSQWGYGIVDYPGEGDTSPIDELVDPNADYLASLSESEQQAYFDALSGRELTEEEISDGTSIYDWRNMGCYGVADNELAGNDPRRSDVHKPVVDAINDMRATLFETPEFLELEATWSECMANGGYPGFATQDDAKDSIAWEFSDLWTEFAVGNALDPSVSAELAEREIRLALADLDCREEMDYAAGRIEAEIAVQQRFVDDYRVELEALRADAEQGR